MKEIELFEYTPTELEEELMKVKRAILLAMFKEGIITEEIKEYWEKEVAIIIKKSSFWKKILDKEKKEEDCLRFVVVKKI